MSPEVIGAIIAASVSVLTVIGALAAQHFGRPATSRNTQEALGEQRKQLDRTLIRLPKRPLFGMCVKGLGPAKENVPDSTARSRP
jgi:hypothetical protein